MFPAGAIAPFCPRIEKEKILAADHRGFGGERTREGDIKIRMLLPDLSQALEFRAIDGI